MLLPSLVICHLAVLTVANPFNKYPYVFLLDVGNEELEKTNTEQIRLSLPGGSLALRYPAIGDGDTISHVRVSGIDFGTDLKANIYDGGPGYKYVVLVFLGNPGVPYDAVLSIQTMTKGSVDYSNENQKFESMNVNNLNQIDDNDDDGDVNDSAEDASDLEEQNRVKVNTELMQSSSNVYKYAQNEAVQSNDYEDDTDVDRDIHKGYRVSPEQIYGSETVEVKDYVDGGDQEADYDGQNDEKDKYSDKSDYQESNGNQANENKLENDSSNSEDEAGNEVKVDSNLYNKYEALRPHFYSNVKVYPVESSHYFQEQSNRPPYDDDTAEIDQMFNDEEIHNDPEKYRDTNNNNYFDSDDSSAVAY